MPVITNLPPAVNTYSYQLRSAIDQRFVTTPAEPIESAGDPGTVQDVVASSIDQLDSALAASITQITDTIDAFQSTIDTVELQLQGNIDQLQQDTNDALALKAPLASPALTGTPTAPTAAPGTNTTQIATTEFVTTSIGAIDLDPLTTDAVNNRVGINIVSPTVALDVGGDIKATGDITAFATSDERLKTDIKRITNALQMVCALDGVFHRWNEQAQSMGYPADEVLVALLANQVEAVLPEVVTTRDNGFKAVRYERVIPLLVEAIKQLNDKIDQIGTK